VVDSLGIIFLDILQDGILFGPNGIPLGLLSSKQRFPDIQ
jgi:hypothetical protein